jgi:hypothetical protein
MSVAATQAARGLRGHALEQISPLARIAFSGRPTALQFTPCQLGEQWTRISSLTPLFCLHHYLFFFGQLVLI